MIGEDDGVFLTRLAPVVRDANLAERDNSIATPDHGCLAPEVNPALQACSLG